MVVVEPEMKIVYRLVTLSCLFRFTTIVKMNKQIYPINSNRIEE